MQTVIRRLCRNIFILHVILALTQNVYRKCYFRGYQYTLWRLIPKMPGLVYEFDVQPKAGLCYVVQEVAGYVTTQAMGGIGSEIFSPRFTKVLTKRPSDRRKFLQCHISHVLTKFYSEHLTCSTFD